MREILFRGKRTDNSEWVEGYYLHISEGEGTYDHEQHFIKTEYKGRFGPCYEVIPETVGQYTGQKDKNGKKIFEGDIVKCSVIYDVGCYPYSKTEIRDVVYRDGCFNPFYDCERSSFEAIGNIHDNLELLKELITEKKEALQFQKRIEELYADAIGAMKRYEAK